MTGTTNDRSIETPEPCTARDLDVMLIIQAKDVPFGVSPRDIREYLAAFIENREPCLHEDILDRMPDIQAHVVGHIPTQVPGSRPCATCGGMGYHLDRHESPCEDCGDGESQGSGRAA